MSLSRSDKLAAKAIFHALTFISTSGLLLPNGAGALAISAIIAELSRREMALFDPWERGLRSSGAPRWHEELTRHSSNYVNAGFLRKERGVWHLTSAGDAALDRGAEYMFDAAHEAYQRHLKQKRSAR